MNRFLCAALCALAGVPALAAPPALTVMTEDYRPFNYPGADGKPTGIMVDVVTQLLRDAGTPSFHIRFVPWARAMAEVKAKPNQCAFSIARLPARETQFRWIGPLAVNEWVLFAKTPLANPPKRLADIGQEPVAGYLGDGSAELLKQLKLNVDVAPREALNPRKLQLGRVKYWAAGKYNGMALLREQGITGIEPVLSMQKVPLWLGCNRDLPAETVARFNAAAAALVKRGDLQRIYDKYGYQP
ncbi:MAG: substrate-binding periplasmic protein [Telluria sp.]